MADKGLLYFIKNISKNNLDISNWKKFKIGGETGLFSVECSKYHDPKDFEDGDIPYIARTAFNNGEIRRIKTDKALYPANCIIIGAESAKAFYQEKPFITGNKIYRIYAKPGKSEMDKMVGLFLCTLLNKIGEKYTYTNAFVSSKIEATEIPLPVDKTGNPDWQYMRDFIRSIYEKLKLIVQ